MSKADDLFFKEFGIVIVLLTMFVIGMFFLANNIGGNSFRLIQNSPTTLAARLAPVGSVRLDGEAVPAPVQVAAAPAAATAGKSGEEVYSGACMACHTTGAAGAPKFGEAEVWKARLEQGLEALVASAINGKGAMPPKGGAAVSDEEVERAVIYILDGAGIDTGASAAATEQPAAEQPAAEAAPAQPAAEAAPASEQPAAETTASAGKPGEEVYQAACVACHATGAAGAPKLGDADAWSQRAATGEDALVNSAIKGKGVMPAKGGNMSLTDDDVRNAVRFILEKSGVSD